MVPELKDRLLFHQKMIPLPWFKIVKYSFLYETICKSVVSQQQFYFSSDSLWVMSERDSVRNLV